MSNAIYDVARKMLLDGQLIWDSSSTNIGVCLIGDGYGSPSISSPTASLADIPVTNRLNGAEGDQGVIFTNAISTTEGAADAEDVTFHTVPLPSPAQDVKAVYIYKKGSTTDETQMKSILWLDSATGLPITPNGGDIIVTWDGGVNKIFRP